jgi:hypothetical protein
VPSEWVIARTVELPSTAIENLQAAIAYEMDRFTPLTAENAFYDFLPLSKNEETVRLFLAVCRADIVTPYIAALDAVSVSVGRIATSLTAGATASAFIANSGALVFAEVRENGYSGGLIIDGRISGLFGDVFDGETSGVKIGKIKEEFSMATASLSDGIALSEAVMVGDESISHETLKRSMASAIILNDRDRARLHLDESSPGLTLAQMGSVIEPLWPKAQGIDLLSKGERKKQPVPVALMVLLLVALAAIALMYAIAPLNIERRRVAEIERQIALLKEPVRKAELLQKGGRSTGTGESNHRGVQERPSTSNGYS